jgi:hypothetical protein
MSDSNDHPRPKQNKFTPSIPHIISEAFSFLKSVLSRNAARKSYTIAQEHKPEPLPKAQKSEHAWSKQTSSRISQTITPPNFLTQHDEDIIKMKAITLMGLRGLRVKSISEIQPSSIQTELLSSSEEVLSRLSVTQTFTPYPGVLMKLRGIIEKGAQKHSRPISESFTLSAEAVDLFPNPLQYTGWALPANLLPSNAKQLPEFAQLFLRKTELEQKLSADELFLAKARERLEFKKNAWKTNLKEFLSLHHQLSAAILNAAGTLDFEKILSAYFNFLEQSPDPLEKLLEVNQMITQENFTEKSMEAVLLNYLQTMNEALSPAFQNLKKSIPLTAFERKLQASLFRQLTFFLEELSMEEIDLYSPTQKQLLSDIAFFRSSTLN